MASERCARACPGWDRSQPIGRQGPAHGEREGVLAAPTPSYHSAVVPCTCGSLSCFPRDRFPPSVPSGCLLRANSSPLPSFALLSPCSSCQPLRTLMGTRPSLGAQGCSLSRLCGLCPPATGQLFPPSPHLGCSTCVCCPVSYGASPDETSARLHLPTRAQVLSHVLSSFSHLFSSYLVTQ